MASILSFPFRFQPNGAAAVVDQNSEAGDREQLAVLALTRRGERPLTPTFGVTDPAFGDGLLAAELAAGVAAFGPPVTIAAVTSKPLSDLEQAVTVEFE